MGAKGLIVMGFPCNQFGAQEPGTDDEISAFVTEKYGVDFPMFSKIEVNGDGACELYQFLTAAAPKEDGDGAITWNFTKFVVGRDGSVLRRFEPMATPEEIGEYLATVL
jgi:glutathione peroxidase